MPQSSRRIPLTLAASLLSAVLLAAPALAQPATSGTPQTNLPRTTLSVGMYRIDAQVAANEQQREIGLMYRKDMPSYEGMLFVFEQANGQCFWMRNTLIALTAAFIADDGSIVNLEDMAPMTDTNHCSAKPVRYVLEMNQGWFAQHHLGAGARLHGAVFEAAAH